MDAIIRASIIYIVLLILFRVVGKRTLGETTTFDLVLLLIISEATQQAMIGQDYSLTNAILVITTLLTIDLLLSFIKQRFKKVETIMEGMPLIIVEDGKMLKKRMDKERIDESDILQKARELQGLERIDQIKYAVLEKSGNITIIPF